jgi:molybdate transport system regulatory protein
MDKARSRVSGRLWLARDDRPDLGAERIALLEAIGAEGSIAAAAKALGISYRSAWDGVNAANNLVDTPLVDRRPGGRHGGATRLTEAGRRVITAFRMMEREYARLLRGLSREVEDLERVQLLMRRLSMRTSARNQLRGEILAFRKGPVNVEVTLALSETERLTSVITRESYEDMGLIKGCEVYALIKASSVILARGDDVLHTSTRNRLCGRVSRLLPGPVNCEVVLGLDGDKSIAAVVTEESVRALGLEEGVRACALIKASHVILGVD